MINERIMNLRKPDLLIHSQRVTVEPFPLHFLPTGKQRGALLLIISILTLQCKLIHAKRLDCISCVLYVMPEYTQYKSIF